MQGFNRYPLAVSVVASVALAGCFGGSSSSDDDDTADLSPVTAENERDVSVEAAKSVEGLFDGDDTTESFSDALSGFSSSSTQTTANNVGAAGNQCSESDISFSEDGDTISYEVDGSCEIDTDQGTAEISGGYVFTSGEWDDQPCDSPQMSQEFIWGGNPIFSGDDPINFYIEGGYGFRWASQMPTPIGDGDYCYAFEYGSTDDGLILETSDRSIDVAPNTTSGLIVEFTVQGGDVVGYNEEVTAGGTFELAEGEFYEVSASGLELRGEDEVDEENLGDSSQFEPGGQFCPNAGSVTISGAEGSEVQVFFGSDTQDAYEVEVHGESSVTEYETCDDFYNDEAITDP